MSNFLTAFWGEIFLGYVRDRLSDINVRFSWITAALLFSFVHLHEGFLPALFAFSVGLTFSTLRCRVGIWSLVLAHWFIDITARFFARPNRDNSYLATAVLLLVEALLAVSPTRTIEPAD